MPALGITYATKEDGGKEKTVHTKQWWFDDANEVRDAINNHKDLFDGVAVVGNAFKADSFVKTGATASDVLLGDGTTTTLSSIGQQTLQEVTDLGATTTNSVTTGGLTITGQTPGQDLLVATTFGGQTSFQVDDNRKVGIGTGVDASANPATAFVRMTDNKAFKFITTSNNDPAVIDDLDLYYSGGNLWFNRNFPSSTLKSYKYKRMKMTGTDADVVGTFNTNSSLISTVLDFNKYDRQSNTYGNSTLLHTGYSYGEKLLDRYQSLGGDTSTGLNIEPNLDPRMYDAMMLSATNGEQGGAGSTIQLFIDLKGNMFVRALGTFAESDYKKVLTDNDNKATTLGSETSEASAKFEVVSTTKGSIPFPKMTEAQRLAIATPVTGLHVYQTDGTEGVYVNKSTGWVQAY